MALELTVPVVTCHKLSLVCAEAEPCTHTYTHTHPFVKQAAFLSLLISIYIHFLRSCFFTTHMHSYYPQ